MQKTEGTNLRVAYYAARRLVVLDLAIQPSALLHALVLGSWALYVSAAEVRGRSETFVQGAPRNQRIRLRSIQEVAVSTPRIESDAVFSPPTGGHALSIDQENMSGL